MTTELALSLASIILSMFTLIWTIFKVVIQFTNRLARVETQAELFWGAAGNAISALIKQPIHFRKDLLMDKMVEDKLNVAELQELKCILLDEINPLLATKDSKALAYALALARIDVLLYRKGYYQEPAGRFGLKKHKMKEGA